MPFDAKAEYGSARAPVRCTINGVEYRSRLSVYGEYAWWIAEAKRPETRERRVRKAIEMLNEGIKHP